MHPLNSQKYFGANGIETLFWNGSAVVSGYIVKQLGPSKFVMTDDGVTHYTRILSPTVTNPTSNLNSNTTYATIPVYPYNSGASGATFTLHYGITNATVVSSSGTHWNVSDTLSAPSGAGSLTVASLSGGHISTVTIGAAGNYTSLFSSPTTFTRAAGSGATFTAHYGVDSAVIVGGGSGSAAGYSASDVLTLAGTGSATIIVDTVDGGGGILTYHVGAVGTVTALPSNPRSVTGGGGTGATFTLKYKLLSVGSSGGSGYNVGDTLIFNGLVATTAPTAHISVATSHAATTVVVDTAGVGITTAASSITSSTTTATFTLKYHLLTISGSGGTGYAVNDILEFNGMVATTLPTAHVATLSGSAVSTVTLDTAGVGITTAPSSVTVSGVTEYASHIYDNHLVTVAGNSYGWTLGASVNGSAFVSVFSA